MENKTALQIFFEDLCHLGYIEYPDENLVQDRLNLALELEKQQIMEAYEKISMLTAEEYYSETYKKPTE